MHVYVGYDSYSGDTYVFEKKEDMDHSQNGEIWDLVTEGEFIRDENIFLENYTYNPIGYVEGKNNTVYLVWSNYNAREVHDNEMEMIEALKNNDENKDAFNAMIELYILYKSGDMADETKEGLERVAGDWIEHTENELIKLGLEHYKLTKDML